MNRKMDMDRANNLHGQTQGQENERRLWHGTSGTNVDNINYRNFNRSYCGQHGKKQEYCITNVYTSGICVMYMYVYS